MKAIKVSVSSDGDGKIMVSYMSLERKNDSVEEDNWDTVMNVLRVLDRYGTIKGGGTGGVLLLDIRQLDINTLG